MLKVQCHPGLCFGAGCNWVTLQCLCLELVVYKWSESCFRQDWNDVVGKAAAEWVGYCPTSSTWVKTSDCDSLQSVVSRADFFLQEARRSISSVRFFSISFWWRVYDLTDMDSTITEVLAMSGLSHSGTTGKAEPWGDKSPFQPWELSRSEHTTKPFVGGLRKLFFGRILGKSPTRWSSGSFTDI